MNCHYKFLFCLSNMFSENRGSLMTSVVSNICLFIQVHLSCIVDWLILNCLTVLVNFSFSLSLLNMLPCWYAMQITFFIFFWVLSSYSLMMAVASSDFFGFAISSKLVDSTFLLSTNELSSCSLTSSLLSLFCLVAMPASPFLDYAPQKSH